MVKSQVGFEALEPEQASNVFCAHQLQMFIMCLLDAVGHMRPAPPPPCLHRKSG